MCPDLKVGRPTLRRQAGFLLPVALFIIVVMGFAVLALWRTTSQSNIASVQEAVTVQALYAAESGLQAGLSELFYPDATSESDVNSRCLSMGTLTVDFTGVTGLNGCNVSVTCQCQDETNSPCTPASKSSVYTLEGIGRCGTGSISSQRTLEVSATMGTDS